MIFFLSFKLLFNVKMFQAFAHNEVVCVNATHGTNAYKFNFMTLLVVDDFGEGFPVAWCISNLEDEVAITCFLQTVQKNGDNAAVKPSWFMSDDANQYFSGWVNTFKHEPQNSFVLGMLTELGEHGLEE
jgi:hypothetical protein